MAELARFEGPLSGGRGINLLSATGTRHLAARGYTEDEYLASGDASSFTAAGDLGADGRWEVVPDRSAGFRTRIVVRRPADPTRFDGTLVVEWHNVSAGQDSAPDWTYLEDEIIRAGHAWVGVSAQRVGVVGGASFVGLDDVGGLRGTDPNRYHSLEHPGDAFAYDLFTQVARALREPVGGDSVDPLDGLRPERALAVGESQSAFKLSGYLNAVHKSARVFDGFLVHSRGAGAGSLDEDRRRQLIDAVPVRIRDDLDTPVIVVETETDVGPLLNYHAARQPDTDRFRLWEIAGTAHADAYQLGGHQGLFGCTHLVNEGPQHYVVKAAMRHLVAWVRDEMPPPVAPRLTVVQGVSGPVVVRDGHGNALGGVRSPLVDVPVATLSGEPPACDNPMCVLFGSTEPFDRARLDSLYPDRSGYLQAFAQALDDAVAAGFVLPEDRAELEAVALGHTWPE